MNIPTRYYYKTPIEGDTNGMITKVIVDRHDIKPIYLQDLKYVAQSLPKIPHMNHEKLIIDSYLNGGWVKVDAYIEFVVELSKEMGIVKPNKSRWRTFTDKVAQYTKELTKSLINAYNQL